MAKDKIKLKRIAEVAGKMLQIVLRLDVVIQPKGKADDNIRPKATNNPFCSDSN